jgi:hypothetical protein
VAWKVLKYAKPFDFRAMMGGVMIIQGKITGSLAQTPKKRISKGDAGLLAILMLALAGFFVLEGMTIAMSL